jgi:hypothetical protein
MGNGKMKNKAFLTSSLLVLMTLLTLDLSGCRRRNQLDPKDDPNVYCQPLSKEVGDIIEYPDAGNESGPKKTVHSFSEYKTAAGFTMRIPSGVGGMDHPNAKCELESGEFHFRWVDGKLMPSVDYSTGRNRSEGTDVKYFVSFSPPSENLVEKFDYPKWMLDDSFKIPGHENVLVLPYAGWMESQHVPKDRKNRANWRAELMLLDARDLAGNAITFTCGVLKYTEKNGLLYADVIYKDFGTNCMGTLAFVSGAGGRLDIYGDNFLDNAAPITNAIVSELNSYIIKEEKRDQF